MYGKNPSADQIYEFILIQKSEQLDLARVSGADKKGRPCTDKCKLYENKCLCRLMENDVLSECNPQECNLFERKGLFARLFY